MNNNLKGSYAYLSGPIDSLEDRGAAWRNIIRPVLKNHFECRILCPLNKPVKGYPHLSEDEEFAKKREEFLRLEDYDAVEALMKDVRHIDLRLVDHSNFLVVYYNRDMHLCGTIEEIATANRQKKPILVMSEQGKKGLPPWMYGKIPYEYFFDNWNELVSHLQYVNDTDPMVLDKRWVFLDEEKM